MIGVGTIVKIVESRTSPPYFKRFVGKTGIIHAIDNDMDYPYTIYLGPHSRFRYMRFSPYELVIEDKVPEYPPPITLIPSPLSRKARRLLLAWERKRAKREKKLLNERDPLTRMDKYWLKMDARKSKKLAEKSQLRELKIKQRWIKHGEAKDRRIVANV